MATLILVPTELELRRLNDAGGFPTDSARVELVGFGPIAAAARTMQLVGQLRPERCLLVGIAGAFATECTPVGTALTFRRVASAGVGVGSGAKFQGPSRLGFPQWSGSGGSGRASASGGPGLEAADAIVEELSLAAVGASPAELLLTTCAASDGPELANQRRRDFPQAVAEDMEGFGVALACALERIPLAIVRGISNAVGDRDTSGWRIADALEAARGLALEALARSDWEGAQESA